MSQHFLLSAGARTLSLKAVMRMSDQEAHATFQAIRWASTGGDPVCPKCGSLGAYRCASRPIFKCRECAAQFSVTSGTIFASRKLPIRDYLAAIAIFVNAVKGISALQLGRDLGVQYKTAFVLAHKIREAMMAEQQGVDELGGPGREVEVDGAYFGGHVRRSNVKANQKDLRLPENQTGKRQVVVVMRERNGRTLPVVVRRETDGAAIVRERVASGTVAHADESGAWEVLHASYEMKRINHSVAFSMDGACTNFAESFFSRLRRAELGQHHHISGKYLVAYANEMAWREDRCRTDNGSLYRMAAAAALAHPVSRVWKGYWQR